MWFCCSENLSKILEFVLNWQQTQTDIWMKYLRMKLWTVLWNPSCFPCSPRKTRIEALTPHRSGLWGCDLQKCGCWHVESIRFSSWLVSQVYNTATVSAADTVFSTTPSLGPPAAWTGISFGFYFCTKPWFRSRRISVTSYCSRSEDSLRLVSRLHGPPDGCFQTMRSDARGIFDTLCWSMIL